uniref:DUF1758 domain-containing protein n=1 Tax=Strongyloides venezuelensis TaxID=75913 RepID=A0A0K0G5W5_STRVS
MKRYKLVYRFLQDIGVLNNMANKSVELVIADTYFSIGFMPSGEKCNPRKVHDVEANVDLFIFIFRPAFF